MKLEWRKPERNSQIDSEAANWVIEIRAGHLDAAARSRFDAWMRSSPQHIRSYLDLSIRWEEMEALVALNSAVVEDLIAACKTESTVVPLRTEADRIASAECRSNSSDTRQVTAPRFGRRSVALAASVLSIAAAVLWSLYYPRGEFFSTAVGEKQSVTLTDGSVIQLNSRSRVHVQYSSVGRDVELLEGEALFDVAKDPARPFLVNGGTAFVRAVGTRFDVYRHAGDTIVAVVEGTVAVSPVNASKAAARDTRLHGMLQYGKYGVLVDAGNQLTVTAKELSGPVNADIDAVTAWTQNRLIFNSAPLALVAEEFSRYNRRPLVVDKTVPKDINISGAFSSTNPAAIVKFLSEQPGLRVVETAEEVRISRE
ncbi:MAG: FecR family protein [Steroidobacteraceae bacterium]